MGRGWQDRRGEPKSSIFAPPSEDPPASPMPSPPGFEQFQNPDGEAGPSGLALPEAVQPPEVIKFAHRSRFPIFEAILPFGRMTKPHGLGRSF